MMKMLIRPIRADKILTRPVKIRWLRMPKSRVYVALRALSRTVTSGRLTFLPGFFLVVSVAEYAVSNSG